MRSPGAFRFPQPASTLGVLLLLAGLSPLARAQYNGGAGDGFSKAGVLNTNLDGQPVLSPAYTASSSGGDGYATAGIRNLPLNGVLPPAVVFTASASGGDGYSRNGNSFIRLDGTGAPSQVFTAGLNGGDGYDFSRLVNRSLDGSSALLVLYSGGTGDGYDAGGFEGRALDPAAAVQLIYSGGVGDGYDKSGAAFVSLGGTDVTLAVIYSASANGGDGYDFEGTRYQALDGSSAPAALFVSSGIGDGYDFSRASFIALNGESAFVVSYPGGSGDGYSKDGFLYVPVNGLALAAEPFIGGSGDGYDSKELPFVQYLGGGEAAAGITFTGWRNSRFSEEEVNDGLADPDVDADGDGMVNLMEFALGSDPRVPDAELFRPQFRLTNLSDLGLPALSDHYLTAIVRRNPLALDATVKVEITDDPAEYWGSNDTIQVDASPSVIIVRDDLGISVAPRRMMRVRATLNP